MGALLAGFVVVGFGAAALADDPDPLAAAWERAAAADSYRFRSEVEQVTTPAASVSNVGRGSKVDQLHLEGSVDGASSRLDLSVWAGGGNVSVDPPDAELRVVEGLAEQRAPGGEWVPSSVGGVVAPGGDVLAYLGAARDIVDLGRQNVAGTMVTVYSFSLDGSVFARAVAEQTEDALRRRGELSPGAQVRPSAFHRDTTGAGKLWVDDAGLPVRQELALRFPEQADGAVSAEIVIDFHDFGDGTSPSWWMLGLDRSTWLLALLGFGSLAALIVFSDRIAGPRRPAAVVLAASLFASVAVATAPVTASAAPVAVEAAPGVDVDARDVWPAMSERLAAPNVSLLDAPSPVAEFEGADDGTDSDTDGLTDFVERRIGTAVDDSDTDGDTIPDLVEVSGFEYPGESGVFWYGDPFQPDSNGDTVGDAVEWDVNGDTTPDDTDADGVPDLFDDDNDGDSVPDHIDSSPFGALPTTWSEDTPMALSISGATTMSDANIGGGLPLFVDFQIRPRSQDHLQFALQPMDWPSDDQGQIRDVNDGADDKDLRLLPTLEIVIRDESHLLPGRDDLDPYSVSVLDLADGERAVYVPLQLVTDDRSGARVAFSGRMPYLSQDAWGQAHEVRLVWMVQMVNDVVCDPAADASEGCGASGYRYDQQQIVHRYYDDWTLTGLQVSQDHGAELAVIHQDPTTGVDDVGATWLLADVLGERFLTPVPGADTVVRDLLIGDLPSELDRDSLGVGEPEAIYGLPNVFQVEAASYVSFAEAVTDTGANLIPSVLEQYDGEWDGPDSVHPLVVTAYESRTRSVGLDGVAESDGTATSSPAGVALDMNPGRIPATIDTNVGIKWTYYCGGDGVVPVWSACDSEAVWGHLEAVSGGVLLNPDDLTEVVDDLDDADAAAQDLAVQLFSMSLTNGVTTLISTDDGVGGATFVQIFDTTDDATLIDETRKLSERSTVAGVGALIKMKANGYYFQRLGNLYPLVKQIAQFKLTSTVKATLSRLSANGIGAKTAIGIGLAIAFIGVATLVAFAATGDETAEDVLKVLFVVGQAVVGVIGPIYMLSKVLKLAGSAIRSVTSLKSAALGLTRQANLLGLVISIGVAWGFFIHGIVSGGVAFYSVEFNQALADTIASTIFAVFMFILASTGVGLIIVGVVALLDGILTLICEVGDVDTGTDLTDGECFTISAAAIKVVSAAVYSYDIMVDVEADDLVKSGDVDFALRDESAGYQVGNHVDVTLPMTTTIRHQEPSAESWQIVPYLWFYSEDNLRTTTMDYTLTTPSPQALTAERDTMAGSWVNPDTYDSYLSKDLWKMSTSEDLEVALSFASAGVNRSFNVYLNTGYAFPSTECWTVPLLFLVPPFVPVCYVRTLDGADSSALDPRVYDVFPATLDDYIETEIRPGGARGLAWDGSIPPFSDADFDGLLSSAFGGLDPDDSTWDTDSDGLSDRFEAEQQADGHPLSLRSDDIDADGLNDAEELRLGTNPGVADTDNDGLDDGDEVRHLDRSGPRPTWLGGWNVTVYTDIVENGVGWTVTPSIGDRTVVVSSDPLLADADGDGIGDEAERQLATTGEPSGRLDENGVPFHPSVFNVSPFAVTLSSDDLDGFVRPSDQVTVRAEGSTTSALEPGVLEFDVPAGLGGPIDPVLLGFDPDGFDGQQTVTVEQTLTVADDAADGQVSVEAVGTVRLPGDNSLPPMWDIEVEEPVAGTGPNGRFALSAPDDASSDEFLITEVGSTTSGGGVNDTAGTGDVRVVPWPNGTPDTLDSDAETYQAWITADGAERAVTRNNQAYLRGANDSETACTTDGECLTVWDHYDNCTTLTINSVQVVEADEPDTSGIEPGVYLRRNDGNGPQLLWFPLLNGGNDMDDGDQRGPNGNGFPVTRVVCGDASLSLFEIDGNANTLNDYEAFQWTTPDGDAEFTINRGDLFPFDETTSFSGTLSFTNLDYREQQTGFDDCSAPGFYCNRVDVNVTIASRPHFRIGARRSSADSGDVSPVGAQFEIAAAAGTTNSEDRNPAVSVWRTAGGSELFWVTWERVDPDNSSRKLMAQLLNPDGTAFGGQATVATLNAATPSGAEIHVLGSRNDTFPVTFWRDRASSTIWSRAGIFSTNQQLVDDATTSVRRETFDVAYDPFTDQTVLVYETDTGAIVAKRFDGASTTPAATITVLPGSGFDTRFDPAVDFVPMTGDWLVTAHSFGEVHTAVVSQGWTSVKSELVGVPATEVEVVCPSWTSVPLVDVRFEELPGATTFPDSSRFANDAATVNGSVAAGVAGAPEASGSDFGVRFDSPIDGLTVPNPTTEESTLAFWFRTELAVDGDPFEIGSGLSSLPIRVADDGEVSFTNSSGTVFTASSDLADGEWHHVTVSVADHSPNRQVNVYVDGALAVVGLDTIDQTTRIDSFLFNGGSSIVDLDHLRVYASSFSASQAEELMDRDDRANCLSVAALPSTTVPPGTSSFSLARHFFDEIDVRGGRLRASAQLGLVIDDDLPVSTVQLPVGVIPNPGGVATSVVIGGTASDATSGIDRVEVRVDGGSWQAAEGTEAWSFPLTVRSGWYTVEVRAFDKAGNAQLVSTPQQLEVDGDEPSLVIDELSALVHPGTDPSSGRRTLALYGTVLDQSPSSGIDRVEVQLTVTGESAGDDGWQAAVIAGSGWSSEYRFPADVPHPVGRFDVHVRAVDEAGNVTTAMDSLLVDGAPPRVAFDGTADVVTGSVVLRGDVADVGAGGVGSVEVSLTPLSDVVNQVSPIWATATVVGGRWSFPVPPGVEDVHQIGLRAVDLVGNEVEQPNVWRGIIDTVAPQVSMSVTSTGRVNAQGTKLEYLVVCRADDRFLDERSFECPGASWREPLRTFAVDDALTELFPDLVGLVGLESTYAVWSSAPPSAVMSACDAYGNCSAANANVISPMRSSGRGAGVVSSSVRTSAVVMSPSPSAEVRGVVTVAFDVVTDDSVASVEVLIDGTTVSSRYFVPGEQSVFEGSIAVPAVAAGERTVAVRVVTHDGQDVMSDPVEFLYDPNPPVVTIASTALDPDDSWGPGTDVYRFSGTVSDDATLQAVQIRIDDGPWVDALFSAGVWSVAVPISDADGAGFAVSVRAIDRAGNTTTVDKTGTVELAPDPGFVRPNSVIDSCDGCAQRAPNATFELSAVAGSNDVAAFECVLDGLPAVTCSSPWTATALSTGVHTLAVTAIDAGGFRDLSPATASWTVAASGPQAVLTAVPADPSGDRSAVFVFTGLAGSVFACSLDGAPFAACASPYQTGDLAYGAHEFRVRATLRGATGTPVAHRWSIVNIAPVASDRTVFTTMDQQVGVTLSAIDSDELGYRIVDAPLFGTLEGLAPDLVYVPFDGFVGFDSFTFEADDSQETSRVAIVNVTVATANPPSVVIRPAEGQRFQVGSGPFRFDVIFNEVVTGLKITDFQISGTAGITSATLSGSGRFYVLTVPNSAVAGTITIALVAGAVTDQFGRSYAARVTSQLMGNELPSVGNGSLPVGPATLLLLLGLALVAGARRRSTGPTRSAVNVST